MIFISYYPTFDELDKLVEQYKPERINIFVDLKNCLSGMYLEEAAKTMLLVHADSKQPPADIYQSWLDFIAFHYRYMYSRTLDVHLFTIADVGQSQYHRNLYKDYKCNRSITGYKTLSAWEQDIVKQIIKTNIEVIIKSAKQLYNSYGVYLSYCESDFCPQYYIQNYYQDPKILNIIYSSDNDMIQTLKYPNTIQFFRRNKDNKMWLTHENWKIKAKLDEDVNIPVANYEYIKAIIGDTGDDVPGVRGIGPKTVIKYIPEVPLASLDQLKQHIETYSTENTKDKKSKAILDNWDVVERNYKLTSYDALIKDITSYIRENLESALNKKTLEFSESVSFLQEMKGRLQ